jgi:hypothetical protein
MDVDLPLLGYTGGHARVGVEVAGSQGMREYGTFRRMTKWTAPWVLAEPVRGLLPEPTPSAPLVHWQTLEPISATIRDSTIFNVRGG